MLKINKNITILKDEVLINNVIHNFTDNYWYAPQDCLLRSTETLIWAKRFFKPPVLDIGIGDGKNSRFLFSMNQKLDLGIDISKNAVRIAKNCGVYDEVRVDDATDLSLKSNSFNTVISHSTFEHIQDDIKAIGQVSRVLNKEGLFYFTTPNPNNLLYLKKMGVKDNEIERYNERLQHYHYRTSEEWGNILAKKGIEIVYVKTYFPYEVQRIWYLLLNIATFKPYKRELWSYLSDIRFRRFVPTILLRQLVYNILQRNVLKAANTAGGWTFIVARKK